MLAKTGSASWAGPMLISDFGGEDPPDEIMSACFEDVLTGRSQGTGWRLPRKRGAGAVQLNGPKGKSARTVHGATLWGGNLMMLTSLLGTPWFPQVDGGILFLEDVGEHPYRIERMLTQLLHAGVLARQRAILLGRFTNFQVYPHDCGFGLSTVVDWLRGQVKAPIYEGLPFGHVPTKVMLPIGAKVDLVVQGEEILLLW